MYRAHACDLLIRCPLQSLEKMKHLLDCRLRNGGPRRIGVQRGPTMASGWLIALPFIAVLHTPSAQMGQSQRQQPSGFSEQESAPACSVPVGQCAVQPAVRGRQNSSLRREPVSLSYAAIQLFTCHCKKDRDLHNNAPRPDMTARRNCCLCNKRA